MKKLTAFLLPLLLLSGLAQADLQVGQKLRVQSVSTNYSMTKFDDMAVVDASGGLRTITLVNASLVKGKSVTVKKAYSDLSINFVAVTSPSLIDGLSTQNLVVRGAWVTLVSDGTTWTIAASSDKSNFVGSAYYLGTASCDWSTTSSTFADYSATAACPSPTVEFNPGPGTISTADNNLPQVTLLNAVPGNYSIIADFADANAAAAANISYRLSDGTTNSGSMYRHQGTGGEQAVVHVSGQFAYSVAQASVTFKMQGAISTSTNQITNDSNTDTAPQRLVFKIYRYPLAGYIAN